MVCSFMVFCKNWGSQWYKPSYTELSGHFFPWLVIIFFIFFHDKSLIWAKWKTAISYKYYHLMANLDVLVHQYFHIQHRLTNCLLVFRFLHFYHPDKPFTAVQISYIIWLQGTFLFLQSRKPDVLFKSLFIRNDFYCACLSGASLCGAVLQITSVVHL